MGSGSRKRRKKNPSDPGDPPYSHKHIRMETDSHADTCALSKDHCVVMQDTGRTVTVVGFGDAVHRVKAVPLFSAVVEESMAGMEGN